jgi:hypothetical protein
MDNAARPQTPARKRGMGLGLLVILLAAATSGGTFWWGRQTIAIPTCEAAACAEGLRFVRYEPIRLGQSNRIDPDGRCVLTAPDGAIRNRSLSRHLQGWQQLTSLTLRYDLVFLAAFVIWGLLVGTLARRARGGSA